jgi:hypothetical protein
MVCGDDRAARVKNSGFASRKSAIRMLYTVMGRGRSDFERFGAAVEPRVRPCQSWPGSDLASADSLGGRKSMTRL